MITTGSLISGLFRKRQLTGWALRYIADSCRQNGNFYGVDLSPRMIDKANKNSEDHDNLHYIEANAEELPFADNYFDKIICTNSFHHYPDPGKAMWEINRILKRPGRIYILDVTADDLLIKWINRQVKQREPAHVNFYSSKKYDDIFFSSGLYPVNHSRLFFYPLKMHVAEKL